MKPIRMFLGLNFLILLFFIVCFAESKPVELSAVNNHIWVHTSYQVYNGFLTPSNGLVVVTTKGLVMIDTCWDNDDTRQLIDLAERKFQQKFILAIVTHGGHADRIGGIDALVERGIKVIGTSRIAEIAKKAGYREPIAKLDNKTDLEIGNIKLQTYFPGEAHTVDNITVWFPNDKILFGGCLVKGENSKNLGNTADANVNEWASTLRNLLKEYPDVKLVIPGHGTPGDKHLIEHTLFLAENT